MVKGAELSWGGVGVGVGVGSRASASQRSGQEVFHGVRLLWTITPTTTRTYTSLTTLTILHCTSMYTLQYTLHSSTYQLNKTTILYVQYIINSIFFYFSSSGTSTPCVSLPVSIPWTVLILSLNIHYQQNLENYVSWAWIRW